MTPTTEQIQKAAESLAKLPSANTLAKRYLSSDDYKYAMYCYQGTNAWRFKSGVEEMVTAIIGKDDWDTLYNSYWSSRDEAGKPLRNYIMDVRSIIQEAFDKTLTDYRLADHFGKKFDVIGTQGARRVLNCEVEGAYALKFDGYFQLSVLNGSGDGTKAGHYDYVSCMDTLKEIAMGLDYLINLNEERCRRELIEMKQRGQLPEGKAIYNKWFINDEAFQAVLNEVADTPEQTFSLLRRGFSDWDSFQVVADEDVDNTSNIWVAVASGMKFTLAHAMQGRVTRLLNTRRLHAASVTNLERQKAKLQAAEDDVDERLDETMKEFRQFDKFLSMASVDESVIKELNKSIKPL